jgi:hypothetical protein
MASTPEDSSRTKIDIRKEIDRSEWKDDPNLVFEQRASLAIARWVMVLFGGIYGLGFVATFLLLAWKDATFEKGADLVRFLVQLPLPLVTLAVGYYLGDRNRPLQSSPKRK